MNLFPYKPSLNYDAPSSASQSYAYFMLQKLQIFMTVLYFIILPVHSKQNVE